MTTDWPKDFPKVLQLTTIAKMKSHPDYTAAKAGDMDAAFNLVDAILCGKEEKISALAIKHPNAMMVNVHAEEASGKNKIPVAIARWISIITQMEIDKDIVQTIKAGRTGSGEWYRLAFRPQFAGKVQIGREYVLVDDVVARGGTFGELRYFIELNGGKVVHMVAGGAARYSVTIAMSESTRYALLQKYDIMALKTFLKEFDIYAGDYRYFTEAEARKLLGAGSLDAARNRIAEERQARGDSAF
jgi:hypothetical protein